MRPSDVQFAIFEDKRQPRYELADERIHSDQQVILRDDTSTSSHGKQCQLLIEFRCGWLHGWTASGLSNAYPGYSGNTPQSRRRFRHHPVRLGAGHQRWPPLGDPEVKQIDRVGVAGFVPELEHIREPVSV